MSICDKPFGGGASIRSSTYHCRKHQVAILCARRFYAGWRGGCRCNFQCLLERAEWQVRLSHHIASTCAFSLYQRFFRIFSPSCLPFDIQALKVDDVAGHGREYSLLTVRVKNIANKRVRSTASTPNTRIRSANRKSREPCACSSFISFQCWDFYGCVQKSDALHTKSLHILCYNLYADKISELFE